MRICAAIAILAIAATARAQFFTPAEVQWLDFRYGGAASGGSSLTTNTLFGNNVTGRWNTLDVVITNLGPRLAGSNITASAAGLLSAQPGFPSTNMAGQTAYRIQIEDSWEATGRGRINATRWRDTGSTGPLATRWTDRGGP